MLTRDRRDKHMKFGGIVYLGEVSASFPLLKELRENFAIRDTIKFVSTKDGKWKGPSRDVHFTGTHESAWDIIDLVLRKC